MTEAEWLASDDPEEMCVLPASLHDSSRLIC
jgi:hypothetical protein